MIYLVKDGSHLGMWGRPVYFPYFVNTPIQVISTVKELKTKIQAVINSFEFTAFMFNRTNA